MEVDEVDTSQRKTLSTGGGATNVQSDGAIMAVLNAEGTNYNGSKWGSMTQKRIGLHPGDIVKFPQQISYHRRRR